jgi:signal transduction histidine kinase
MPTSKPIEVLLVEDNIPDACLVREILPSDHHVVHVKSLEEAQAKLDASAFDVLLLDLTLPDGSGLLTFRSLVARTLSVPIIVLSGLDDEEIAATLVESGAQDYILKRELSESILVRSIRYAIHRKKAEEKINRLAVLEQREEFMATLTHDLKNPLIGANRILELMAGGIMGEVSQQQETVLFQLRDSNKLLLWMIQNRIEVYRFEKDVNVMMREDTDLGEIITACLDEIRPIAKNRDIELISNFIEQAVSLKVDPNAIRRMLQNLLDNALKFTPRGGAISLKLQNLQEKIVIEIVDTGSGISLEEQKFLFQRFSQGKSRRKYTPGTGLGLYLCKQIVDAHQGEIVCISAEGAGTTFRICLLTAS